MSTKVSKWTDNTGAKREREIKKGEGGLQENQFDKVKKTVIPD